MSTPSRPPGRPLADFGDVLTYTYTVTNTDTSTLSGVALAPTRGIGVVVLSGDPASLAPGASVTYRATTTVTQADVDSPDPVTETATASATGRRLCRVHLPPPHGRRATPASLTGRRVDAPRPGTTKAPSRCGRGPSSSRRRNRV
jgi:hypothetical protein